VIDTNHTQEENGAAGWAESVPMKVSQTSYQTTQNIESQSGERTIPITGERIIPKQHTLSQEKIFATEKLSASHDLRRFRFVCLLAEREDCNIETDIDIAPRKFVSPQVVATTVPIPTDERLLVIGFGGGLLHERRTRTVGTHLGVSPTH